MTSRSSSPRPFTAASSHARSSRSRTADSGDGAASPGRRSSAARTASPARRPAERRRLRASLATIRSSHGRNGAPSRNRPSARMGLDEGLLDRILGVAVGREQVRRPDGGILVAPNERLVGHDVASPRAFDQLGVACRRIVFQWTALHRQPYPLHRGLRPRSRLSRLDEPSRVPCYKQRPVRPACGSLRFRSLAGIARRLYGRRPSGDRVGVARSAMTVSVRPPDPAPRRRRRPMS